MTIPRAIKIFFSLRSDMSSHQTAHIDICKKKKKKKSAFNTSGLLLFDVYSSRHHGNPCAPGTGLSQQKGSVFLCPVLEGGFPGFCCLFPNGNPLFIINRGRDSTELIYESLFLLFAIQQE